MLGEIDIIIGLVKCQDNPEKVVDFRSGLHLRARDLFISLDLRRVFVACWKCQYFSGPGRCGWRYGARDRHACGAVDLRAAPGRALSRADHPGTERGGHPVPVGGRPGAYSHRPGAEWKLTAVRAILASPRYTGHQVWNRQPTAMDRIEPGNTGLGHRPVQRRGLPDGWVISNKPAHACPRDHPHLRPTRRDPPDAPGISRDHHRESELTPGRPAPASPENTGRKEEN